MRLPMLFEINYYNNILNKYLLNDNKNLLNFSLSKKIIWKYLIPIYNS